MMMENAQTLKKAGWTMADREEGGSGRGPDWRAEERGGAHGLYPRAAGEETEDEDSEGGEAGQGDGRHGRVAETGKGPE